MGASEEHSLLGSFRVFLPVVMTPCGVRLCEVCGSFFFGSLCRSAPWLSEYGQGAYIFLEWKPKKGNFSYFGIWFSGCENRVFVRGSLFSGGVFGVVCIPVCNMFCFGYITMFLLGCFGWFPARFILCL